MKLSRDKIQRMIGSQGSMGGAGGGVAGITEQRVQELLQDYVTNDDLTATLVPYATKEWVDDNYLSISFFNALFQAKKADGTTTVAPNDGDTDEIDSIKAMFGFWTDQYLSALGQCDDGSAGVGDVTWALLADPDDTRQIAISHLTMALSNYATTSWITNQNYATQTWVTSQGYATSATVNALEFVNAVTGGNGFFTLSTNKGNSFVLDLSHQHSWFGIQDRPTTLAGFGIADAYISNGVITIGGNTITPVTQVAMTVPTGFDIAGSPITKTGTLAVTYSTGYEGFTTALKQKIEALYSWFEVDADGNVKTKDWDDNGTSKHRGFYSPSFISALGQGDDGSAGSGDVTWALLADSNDTRQIASSHLSTALAGYATQQWVTNQNYATQTWVTSQGYATSATVNALEFVNAVTGGNGFFTLSTNKGNSFVLDLSHQHSWFGIQDRPTTLAGFGIADAYISNGVITIGGNTITPVTQVAMTVPTGFDIAGSPITKTGTLAVTYSTGYEGFTTALKQKIEALYSWFEVDADGNVKTKDWDDNGTSKHRGFYSPSFISALGQGDDGSAGSGDVTWALLADSNDTRQIASSHLSTALAGYATQQWVTNQNYATQTWVTSQGYATAAAVNALEFVNAATGGNGFFALSTNKGNSFVLDLTHHHSWFGIQDRPTTIAGLGVKSDLDSILSSYVLTSALRSLIIQGDGSSIGSYLPTSAMTFNFVAGTNMRIDRDATYHKLTFVNTYEHPTGGADTTILSADGRVLSSISVNSYGHVTSVGYKTLAMADMPSAMAYYNNITTSNNGTVKFGGYNISDAVLDLTHQHSWFDIQDRPTTLKGYGIDKDDPLLKDNYLTISFFERLFQAYSGNTQVHPNSTATIDNIKAMFGFWTEQYVSALGNGIDGASGSFDEDQMWVALGTTVATKQISANYLTAATRYNNVAVGRNGSIVFSGVGVNNAVIDLTHDHCFGELKATPDSLAGYGIKDAYILGTKVYLGNQSIDVSGSQIDLTGYATQAWVTSNYQPKGNYLTSADLSNYVQKSGATMTGTLYRKMTADTSNFEWTNAWVNTSGTVIASIGYHNTVHRIFLNPVGSSSIYDDAVGKYSLVIGENELTYNTKTIIHSGNIGNQSVSYATSAGSASSATYAGYISYLGNVDPISGTDTFDGGLRLYGAYNKAGYPTTYGNVLRIGGGGYGEMLFGWTATTANGGLYYRSKRDVAATSWSDWVTVITSDNIGSQSVNYANSAGNADTVDGYHSSSFLLLSGGTMTGTLSVATGLGISDASGNGLLVYKPSSWTGVSSGQWGVGTVDVQGVIRSSNTALQHYRYNDGTYDIIDSKGGQTISNSLQVASVEIGHTNEINATGTNTLYLQYRNNGNLCLCYNGYYVGIGTSNPTYKLHVSGDIYATGGVTSLSDARKKDVVSNVKLSVYDIANAPAIKFLWKHDRSLGYQAGTIAQYWKNVLPEVVTDKNNELSMQYGVTALIASIIIAKKVTEHERRISELEIESKALKEENRILKEEITRIKAA